MPVPAPSCSGCSTRPPPPSARSPTPAPPPASTANTRRRSPTPTDQAPDPATQLTMKDGRRIPPGRNASAADPFYWLGREERRCLISGLKGIAMRRFGLAATLAAVLVLLSASAALAPPTNKDELLKDEQHRLQQSNTLYQGGQKARPGVQHGGRRPARPGRPWVQRRRVGP